MKTMTEAAVRADERQRVAALIMENHEAIADYAADKDLAVQLVAHLLRSHMTDSDLRHVSSEILNP